MAKRSNDKPNAGANKKSKKQPQSHKVVVLKADGKMIDAQVKSPEDANSLVGGEGAVFGQWEDYGIVMIGSVDQENKKLKKNKCEFQVPCKGEDINGDLVVMKMNEDGDLENFTVADYKEFLQEEIEDEEDIDFDEYFNNMSTMLKEELAEEFSRELTEIEVAVLDHTFEEGKKAIHGDADEDEDEDEVDLEAVGKKLQVDVAKWFEETYKRKMDDTEESICHRSIERCCNADTGIMDADQLLTSLIENFKADNNRDPTEAERNELTQQAVKMMEGFEVGSEVDSEGDEEDTEAESADDE